MIMFSKRTILEVRLLGAIALDLVILITRSIPEPVQKLAPSRVARGEVGAHIVSFAVSPTSAQIATTNQVGRLTLRAPEGEWQTDRFLNFPGYAMEVAFSPDGRTVAAVGSAPGICLWDLRSPRNEPNNTVMVPIQQPKNILFSPDGKFIAVTSYLDGTILLARQ
jgi:WD40 repeat protein